ncbi:hypothetical protein GCM10007939_02860 [Amylibacter marinus]|uniref:Group 4 capsule polysaccharide lipoprotein gfcB, YjbF n=1 Tax=Amylibacter marinus TaxID=1475483 RepID=A0ABQ5VSB1_9RHOB|nr:YjbF family lipoprotein [Amylibacter marinus]GLQ34003.1 hypothetical protein GCM10007939_02860 [Amylibacter marinus]
MKIPFISMGAIVLISGCTELIEPRASDASQSGMEQVGARFQVLRQNTDAVANYNLLQSRGEIKVLRADDSSLLIMNGVRLIQTVGLGLDLHSYHANVPAAQVQARFEAHYRHVKFQDQVGQLTLICGSQVSQAQPRIIDETCLGEDLKIENSFWFSHDGRRITKSRQWVSDEIGYLVILHP